MKRYRTQWSAALLGLGLAGASFAQPVFTYKLIPAPDGVQSFYAWMGQEGTIRGGSGLVDAGQGIQLRQCYTYKDGAWTVVPAPSANCLFTGGDKTGDFTGTLQLPGEQGNHLFRYHNGGFELLDSMIPRTLAGPALAAPTAMNGLGDLAGWVQIQDLKPYTVPFGPSGSLTSGVIQTYGFVYSGGQIRELPKLSNTPVVTGISTLGPFEYAYGINENGDVAGYAVLQIPSSPLDTAYTEHAVLWRHDGGVTDIGTAGGTWSQALAINASGQIAGKTSLRDGEIDPTGHYIYHAFLYENGAMRVLPVPGVYSVAEGVSDDGGVLGSYYQAKGDGSVDFSTPRPFYWYRDNTPEGKAVDLQSLVQDLPGDILLTAATIRSNGQILATGNRSGDPNTAVQLVLAPLGAH
jgi:uncharacterized membrane protein